MPRLELEETSAEPLRFSPSRETQFDRPSRVPQPRLRQKQDYLAYMVPTTLVVPMFAYGTKLEPVLAGIILLGWGIYAAVRRARAVRTHEPASLLGNRAQ